jgi:hypothetical protein
MRILGRPRAFQDAFDRNKFIFLAGLLILSILHHLHAVVIVAVE